MSTTSPDPYFGDGVMERNLHFCLYIVHTRAQATTDSDSGDHLSTMCHRNEESELNQKL